ncbi:hypothetical protein CLAIMM_02780 [Cladophialophora immunda]|nr:hypothetical protein CLAIMM_02780 [Cladophialophora immunda]
MFAPWLPTQHSTALQTPKDRTDTGRGSALHVNVMGLKERVSTGQRKIQQGRMDTVVAESVCQHTHTHLRSHEWAGLPLGSSHRTVASPSEPELRVLRFLSMD